MPALGDENVGRFDIAMNDAFGVSGIERVRDFDREGEQHFGFERTSRNAMLQGQSIEELHGNEGMPVVFADVMNGANIGMI